MPRLSALIPRKALHVVALMAMVGVLWSGAGVDFWIAACSDDLHLVSPLEKTDGEPEEDHEKDQQQEVKITGSLLECPYVPAHGKLRPVRVVCLSTLHQVDVLTPPPEC